MPKKAKEKPAQRGREPLFNPEARGLFIQNIRQGRSIKDSAAAAMISVGTVNWWARMGEAIQEGRFDYPNLPADEGKRQDYLTFLIEYKNAQTAMRNLSVLQIQSAGRDTWTHRKTGIRRATPPPGPVTWMHKQTGALSFEAPGEADADQYELQYSGDAWEYAQGTWQAAAWMLERTDPESWARKDTLRLEGVTPKEVNEIIALMKANGIDVADGFAAMRDRLQRALDDES